MADELSNLVLNGMYIVQVVIDNVNCHNFSVLKLNRVDK